MKTFIDINPGVASRIGYKFDFPDYSTEELIQIFNKKTSTMGFSLEKGIDTKLKVIFDYFIKRKAFGNGRFVDKVIQETIMKHAVSEQDDDIKLIHISDIPEIEDLINSKNSEKKSVEDTFKNIIGMQTVKEKLLQFEKYVNFQTKATEMGIELKSLSCHMVFTGNPGTGKTTVARIIAKMLFDMSVIKENKLIEVERKDLVARYIGQTAPKTYEVIEKAMGGVLFIDEAYTLSKKTGANDSFGEEAIATLIKSMEDHKGEFVVIFAGYRNEMKEFLDVNPGIRSRIGYTFDFPDYSPEELTEMFEKNVTNMGFVCDDKSIKEVLNLCEYFSKRKDFGNGRFIDKVIQAMLLKHAENSSKNIKKITIKDIPTIEEMNNVRKTNDSTASEMITNLVGMKNIKDKLKDFECYVEFVKEAKEKDLKLPSQNMHMIFTGNPGTGKTTVARIIAKMLFDLGIIHENKLIEVERKDLIAGYIGQTAPKTYDVIEKAMGGVLFIDEAYTLNQKTGVNDNFGEEAIATLIKAMEDHKGEFIVIFAGYKNEMKEFINMNPGISSRIGYVFDFEDYTREELCEIYYRNLDKIGLKLDEDAKENVVQIMNYFQNVDNIGNGRFVDKVVGETIIKHSKNKKRIIDRINKDEIPTIKEIAENLMNGKNMIDVEKITDEELRKTAIHEIGHAMVRYLKFKTPGIKIITINPEGSGTLGYVQYDISYDGNTHTKREILDRIDVSLAGLASEQVFNGNYESGGSSDLEKSTNLARRMITFYGMGNKGLAYVDKPQGEVEALIYNQVNEILQECFDETVKLIEKNKNTMERLVEYLLKNKEIDEKTFKKIITKKNSDFKVNNNPTIYY
jgi:AAA+ superfamily predicted ATPase